MLGMGRCEFEMLESTKPTCLGMCGRGFKASGYRGTLGWSSRLFRVWGAQTQKIPGRFMTAWKRIQATAQGHSLEFFVSRRAAMTRSVGLSLDHNTQLRAQYQVMASYAGCPGTKSSRQGNQASLSESQLISKGLEDEHLQTLRGASDRSTGEIPRAVPHIDMRIVLQH